MLTDAINAIVQDLQQNTQPGPPAVASRIGARWLNNHLDAAPRLVWTRQRETPGDRRNLGTNPRQVATRHIEVWVYLWAPPTAPDDLGDSDAPAEQLLNNLLASVHRCTYGYWEQGEATWASETGAVDQYGATVVQVLYFDIPVTEPALDTAKATTMTIATIPST